jgi:hypothetical protein
MKSMAIIGVVVVALVTLALAYHRIMYTTRKKVVNIGPIRATAKTEKTIPLPPVVGGLALVGGIALIVIGNKK